MRIFLMPLVLLSFALNVSAAGNIDDTDKFAWSANAGWADFNPEYGGATVRDGYLDGYAWAENVGWIKLGADGGGPYGNTGADDWGVNNDNYGNLSGFAWSSSAGWVDFNPDGGQQVSIDADGRFSGYAWAENVGWICFSASAPVAYGVETTWRPWALPSVASYAVSDINPTTATGNGGITGLGVPNPTQHGVCWSTADNPTVADAKTADGAVAATGTFSSAITGLDSGTTYHVRAYAANAAGTVYGDDVQFTTAVTVAAAAGDDGKVKLGAGGTPAAEVSEIVQYGGDATEIHAVADAGHHFTSWSDGSTDNPRTDTNVTADVSVTAGFAINSYTLTYAAGSGGAISGESPQTVDYAATASPVTAMPDTGYHFTGWSDGSTDNPRTDTNVTADVSVTAEFALDGFSLAYTAGENGSIEGDSRQTVSYGGDGSAVTAVPDQYYRFVQWSDGSTANPRTDTDVTADVSVTAEFALDLALARGKKFTIAAESLSAWPEFNRGTKVYAAYSDPFKQNVKKAPIKLLTKIDRKSPAESIDCEWRKKIRLYDRKGFKTAQKAGESAMPWLASAAHQKALDVDIHVKYKKSAAVAGQMLLVPPEISEISGESTLTVTGKWFGDKKPKVWLEYVDAKGAVKGQRCKVLPPDGEYQNVKGKNSYMDPETGDSRLVLELPSKAPKGELNGVLVIDNAVGMAAEKLIAD